MYRAIWQMMERVRLSRANMLERRFLWVISVLMMLAGTARPAVAQHDLRGVVRDSTTASQLPGAIVTVLDTSGSALARTLTDANGRFRVAIGSHAARLHLIRIGYRPLDVPVPPLDRRGDTLELHMTRPPALLVAVQVSDKALCPGSFDHGAAFELWDQARAGLLAAVLSGEATPALAQSLVYTRRMPAHSDRVIYQQTDEHSGEMTRPFYAVESPATFARRGYLEEDRDGRRVYAGPDAEVLLDTSFAATHCFRVRHSDADHPSQIGVAFTPVESRARDSLVDVRGTIWIDSASPQLRSLEFSYTALEPAAMLAGAGGHIEFRQAPNGTALTQQWSLRLPSVVIKIHESTQSRRKRSDAFVDGISETGGVVLDAAWPEGVEWHEPATGIEGVVTRGSGNGGARVANALVALAGTNDTTRADAQGQFRLAPLVPGTYSIVAVDSSVHDVLSADTPGIPVTVGRGVVTHVSLILTPLRHTVVDRCRGQDAPDGTSVLAGQLDLIGRWSPSDLTVRATWQPDDPRVVTPQPRSIDVPIDGRNRFVVCGVSRGRHVELSLMQGDISLADTTVTVDRSSAMPVSWRAP